MALKEKDLFSTKKKKKNLQRSIVDHTSLCFVPDRSGAALPAALRSIEVRI